MNGANGGVTVANDADNDVGEEEGDDDDVWEWRWVRRGTVQVL